MSSHMKDDPLLPATPWLAKRVWDAQRRPSARKVARALRQAGYDCHFVTINRWRAQGWRAVQRARQAIDAASADLDAAIPVLTRNPTSRAADLVDRSETKPQLEQLSDKELLIVAARTALITVNVLGRELHAQAAELLQARPAEMGILIKALAEQYEAATAALVQALAPKTEKLK
jgi:hypothetical protein